MDQQRTQQIFEEIKAVISNQKKQNGFYQTQEHEIGMIEHICNITQAYLIETTEKSTQNHSIINKFSSKQQMNQYEETKQQAKGYCTNSNSINKTKIERQECTNEQSTSQIKSESIIRDIKHSKRAKQEINANKQYDDLLGVQNQQQQMLDLLSITNDQDTSDFFPIQPDSPKQLQIQTQEFNLNYNNLEIKQEDMNHNIYLINNLLSRQPSLQIQPKSEHLSQIITSPNFIHAIVNKQDIDVQKDKSPSKKEINQIKSEIAQESLIKLSFYNQIKKEQFNKCISILDELGYCIKDELSQQDDTSVFVGYHRLNNTHVVIKLSYFDANEWEDITDLLKLFENKSKQLQQKNCSSVVQIYKYFTYINTFVQVQELCQYSLKSQLESLIKRNCIFEVLCLVFLTINSLQQMHKQNLVHLNLKLSNILVSQSGDIKFINLYNSEDNYKEISLNKLKRKQKDSSGLNFHEKQLIEFYNHKDIGQDGEQEDKLKLGLLLIDICKKLQRNQQPDASSSEVSQIKSIILFIKKWIFDILINNNYFQKQIENQIFNFECWVGEINLFIQSTARLLNVLNFEKLSVNFQKDFLKHKCKIYEELNKRNYYLKKYIDKGGQGYVFDGFKFKEIENTIIIKIVFSDFNQQQSQKEFEEEIEIMKALNGHSNIISLIDNIKTDDFYILVLNKCKSNLKRQLEQIQIQPKKQKCKKRELLRMIFDLLDGLIYMRIKYVLHLDIKPQNILYYYNGTYKTYIYIDFGCSAVNGITDVKGRTLKYAPKELKDQNIDQIDYLSDVYSLGKTFEEILNVFERFKQNKARQEILNRFKKFVSQFMVKEKKNERKDCIFLHQQFFNQLNYRNDKKFLSLYLLKMCSLMELIFIQKTKKEEICEKTLEAIKLYQEQSLKKFEMFSQNQNEDDDRSYFLLSFNIFNSIEMNKQFQNKFNLNNGQSLYSLQYYQMIEKSYSQNLKMLIISSNTIADHHYKQGEIQFSLNYLQNCVKLLLSQQQQKDDKIYNKSLFTIYIKIQDCLTQLHRYKEALYYSQESYNLLSKIDKKSQQKLEDSLNNLAVNYYKNQQLNEAIQYQQELLKLLISKNDRIGISLCQLKIGYFYFKNNEIKESIQFLKEAICQNDYLNSQNIQIIGVNNIFLRDQIGYQKYSKQQLKIFFQFSQAKDPIFKDFLFSFNMYWQQLFPNEEISKYSLQQSLKYYISLKNSLESFNINKMIKSYRIGGLLKTYHQKYFEYVQQQSLIKKSKILLVCNREDQINNEINFEIGFQQDIISQYKKVNQAYQKVAKSKHPSYASFLNSIGNFYSRIYYHQVAQKYYKQSLGMANSIYKKNDILDINYIKDLRDKQQKLSDFQNDPKYQDIQNLIDQYLKQLSDSQIPLNQQLDLFQQLFNQQQYFSSQSDLCQLIKYIRDKYLQQLQDQQNALNFKCELIKDLRNNYLELQDYQNALKCELNILEMKKINYQNYKIIDPDIYAFLIIVPNLLETLVDKSKLEHLKIATDIIEPNLSVPDILDSIFTIGQLNYEIRNYRATKKYLKQYLEMSNLFYKGNTIQTIKCLKLIMEYYFEQKNNSKAIEYSQQILGLTKQLYKNNSIKLKQTLEYICYYYHLYGEHQQANILQKQLLIIRGDIIKQNINEIEDQNYDFELFFLELENDGKKDEVKYEKNQNEEKFALKLSLEGFYYFNINNEVSLKYFLESVKMYQHLSSYSKWNFQIQYFIIGLILFSQFQYEMAIEYQLQFFSSSIKLLANLQDEIINIQRNNEEIGKLCTLKLLKEKQQKIKQLIAMSMIIIILSYFEIGNEQQALSCLFQFYQDLSMFISSKQNSHEQKILKLINKKYFIQSQFYKLVIYSLKNLRERNQLFKRYLSYLISPALIIKSSKILCFSQEMILGRKLCYIENVMSINKDRIQSIQTYLDYFSTNNIFGSQYNFNACKINHQCFNESKDIKMQIKKQESNKLICQLLSNFKYKEELIIKQKQHQDIQQLLEPFIKSKNIKVRVFRNSDGYHLLQFRFLNNSPKQLQQQPNKKYTKDSNCVQISKINNKNSYLLGANLFIYSLLFLTDFIK